MELEDAPRVLETDMSDVEAGLGRPHQMRCNAACKSVSVLAEIAQVSTILTRTRSTTDSKNQIKAMDTAGTGCMPPHLLRILHGQHIAHHTEAIPRVRRLDIAPRLSSLARRPPVPSCKRALSPLITGMAMGKGTWGS